MPNIGPKGQRRRATWGTGMLLLAIVLAVWLIAGDRPRGWRLLLFFPLWAAGLGLFQAKEKT